MSAKLCSLIPDNYARALKKDNFFGQENREKAIGVSKREQSQFGEPNTSCNANLFFGFFSITRKITIGWLQQANEYSNVARLYDAFLGQSVPGVLPKGVDWKLEKNSRF